MPKSKKPEDEDTTQNEDTHIIDLTADLQRTRADFENYRKRVEVEKVAAKYAGQSAAILKLLPVIDNIERAIAYTPDDIKDHTWVKGVSNLAKNLEKSLSALHLYRIDAKPGTEFNPNLHEAIQFDEDATGDKEVVAEELQAGYILDEQPIRHAMVKVTRR